MDPSIPLNIVKWLLEYGDANIEAERQKKLTNLSYVLIEKYEKAERIKGGHPMHRKKKMPAIILSAISEIGNIIASGGGFSDIRYACADLYAALLILARMDPLAEVPKLARPLMAFSPFTSGIIIMGANTATLNLYYFNNQMVI